MDRADRALNDAVATVFKAEAPAFELLREAQAVQAKLIDPRVKLRHLHRSGLIADAHTDEVRSFLFKTHVLPATTGQVTNTVNGCRASPQQSSLG